MGSYKAVERISDQNKESNQITKQGKYELQLTTVTKIGIRNHSAIFG